MPRMHLDEAVVIAGILFMVIYSVNRYRGKMRKTGRKFCLTGKVFLIELTINRDLRSWWERIINLNHNAMSSTV